MKASRSNDVRHPQGLFVGLATVDISYTVDDIPRLNQKISVQAQLITAGGPATNAAATFAFLGGRSTLVSAVGSHALAKIVREDLARSSIRLHDMAGGRGEALPVSTVMVHRASGDRTVVSANAAVFSPVNARFDSKWLRGVEIVEVDGQYMPLCIAAAGAAHERGIPVVLDSGSWKPGMAKLLPFLDSAICSGDFRPPGCRSENDVFEFLAGRGIPRVAITRGDSSIRFVDSGESGEIRVRKVRPIDTLGAGDIFHGAHCYYACQAGASFREALRAASEVASFSIRYAGTRSWMSRFRQNKSEKG
jgi:sugar/nucleoside kinase (ribokinase family)